MKMLSNPPVNPDACERAAMHPGCRARAGYRARYAAHTTFRLCTSVRRRQRMTKMYCRSIGSRLAATMKPSLSATLYRTTVHGRGCQSLRKNKAKSWVTCYSLRFASLTPNLTSGSPFWLP